MAANHGSWRSLARGQKCSLTCTFAPNRLVTGSAEIGLGPPEKREVTGSTPVPTTTKPQVSGGAGSPADHPIAPACH
jgi:hypothetical protein